MAFKVTHIDAALCRHVRTVVADSTALAIGWMCQLYGPALAVSAIRKGGAA